MLQLSEEQHAAFYRAGDLRIAQAITTSAVERALSALNADLGRGLDTARIEPLRALVLSHAARPTRDPRLVRGDSGRGFADALVAPAGVRSPQLAQIALLFPSGSRLLEGAPVLAAASGWQLRAYEGCA